VREFTTNDIPKEIIEDIIDCARLAPTARNTQPWEFVVVTENEKLRQLAKVTEYGGFIANASACVVVCCQDTKYYLEDGSAATENILLAAKAHDIGSCWIAGDKKPHCEDIKKLLGIPENMKVVSIVPLGYPERKMLPVGKRDLKDVLHWEKF
jgi:nitroreductase